MDKNKLINIIIELLKEGKTTEIMAHGISMFPILKPGDHLKISPTHKLTKGDIVVFKGVETLVAHRIISMVGDTITCKGDSLIIPDPILKKDNLLGVVIGRSREGKYRPIDHWTFKLMSKLMPPLGKYPRLIIRYSALIYSKLNKKSLKVE